MFKKFIFPLTLIALLLCAVSCGSSPEEKVAQKIENGEKLTKEDYDIMYGYYIDQIKSVLESAKDEDEAEAVAKISELSESGLMETFEKEIGERNVEMIVFSLMMGVPVHPSDFYPAEFKSPSSEAEEAKEAAEVMQVAEVQNVPETVAIPEEKEISESRPYEEIYEGKIGPYPIRMWLYVREVTPDGIGERFSITGKYSYTKNGTTLDLKGFEYKDSGIIELDEYTSKGVNSGSFELKRSFDNDGYNVKGTFTNLTNGKEFEVRLKNAN